MARIQAESKSEAEKLRKEFYQHQMHQQQMHDTKLKQIQREHNMNLAEKEMDRRRLQQQFNEERV